MTDVEPEFLWPDEPVWVTGLERGSWVRLKDLDTLNQLNKVVHPRWRITEEIIRLQSTRLQISGVSSYHGNRNLLGLFGVIGHWLPLFFDLEQQQPSPIDYAWSGEVAKLYSRQE